VSRLDDDPLRTHRSRCEVVLDTTEHGATLRDNLNHFTKGGE
jgi:hypothetical protein